MRWTDALGLYNVSDDELYRLSRCRAAQVYEHCILTRRIFRSDSRRIASLSSNATLVRAVPVVSRTWREANAVLSSFSHAEYELVAVSPVRSAEADTLVNKGAGAVWDSRTH